jgi:two-component system sensor histidine kinase/response regulator
MILPAHHRKDDVTRLAMLGVGGYLVRPMEPVKLVETLGGIVERVRSGGAVTRTNERRQLRILLAEDSEDNRTLIRFFLQKTECEVECAENGELAVGKFMERSYDLVLMDLQMPMLDGLAATQAIRRWEGSHGRPATPIVALSAHALPEDVQRSIEAGCSAHLTKPIRRDRLIAAIQEYTRG